MQDVVQRLKDSRLGANTLVTLEELLPFGLDVVMFKDGAPSSRERFMDFDLVELSLLTDQALGEDADDSDLEQKMIAARQAYDSLDVEYGSENWREQAAESSRLSNELAVAQDHYHNFRPTILTEKVRQADLVVVPSNVVDKLRREVPDVRIAVLEDGTQDVSLWSEVEGQNYPRILARALKDREGNKEPRVDDTTRDLLFKRHAERGERDWFSFGSYSDRLDSSFYGVLRGRVFASPVHRSSFTKDVATRGVRSGILGGANLNEGEVEITHNFFQLGGRWTGYKYTSNGFLNDSRKRKSRAVRAHYEDLWTTPKESVAEAEDKLSLLEQLVTDSSHFDSVARLADSLNVLVEPHLHLSSMAKLVSANTLHSRWGAHIEREPFYQDFMRVAEGFVRNYETVVESVAVIDANSREMQIALESIKAHTEREGRLHSTYAFLKSVVDTEPSDFRQLQQLFERRLKDAGATLIKELEEYDPRKDPAFDDDKLPVRKGEARVSTRNYKSPYLLDLLERFHEQNPVTGSEEALAHCDDIAAKLTAYTAMAQFIQENNWTRPEIAPPNEGVLNITKGWYPLTRLQHTREHVPNNTVLDGERRIEIIDGPNVGGKTIDTKKSLFVATLAVSGNYVPAEHARVSFFERVRFRLKQTGMHRGSALEDELKELTPVIDALDLPTLIGLDETFTSTNDVEGEAMTWGLSRRLLDSPTARAIITSHYPSLHDIVDDPRMSGVAFSHFRYSVNGGGLNFNHEKQSGPNIQGDYAIVIARHEGVHPSIIGYAEDYIGSQSTVVAQSSTVEVDTFESILDAKTAEVLYDSRNAGNRIKDIALSFTGTDDLLKQALQKPLSDLGEINERLDVIGELVEDEELRETLDTVSSVMSLDYEKSLYEPLSEFNRWRGLGSSFASERTKKLRRAIGSIAAITRDLPDNMGKDAYQTETLEGIAREYRSWMQDDASSSLRAFWVYLQDVDDKLTELEKSEEGQDRNEITFEQLDQTLEQKRLEEFRSVARGRPDFSDTLDLHIALANMAVGGKYTRPEVVPKEENCLEIKAGRYDRLRWGDPVPNDTYLSGGYRVEVIEGPNAAGKTVDMKKALLIAAMAQAGSWVPAEYAKVSLRDRIILREKGDGDTISAFQQDCKSTREVTPPEGEYWLIGMDETFTSTEKRGGEALTYGFARSILDQQNSLVIISSHYTSLSDRLGEVQGTQFSHFDFETGLAERDPERTVVLFPHKKTSGPLQEFAYGIVVAETKEFDKLTLDYARDRIAARSSI